MSWLDKDKWVRHPITVPEYERTYQHIEKAEDWTRTNHKGVDVVVSEIVTCYDVYREKRGKHTLNQLWHRGAKVSA